MLRRYCPGQSPTQPHAQNLQSARSAEDWHDVFQLVLLGSVETRFSSGQLYCH